MTEEIDGSDFELDINIQHRQLLADLLRDHSRIQGDPSEKLILTTGSHLLSCPQSPIFMSRESFDDDELRNNNNTLKDGEVQDDDKCHCFKDSATQVPPWSSPSYTVSYSPYLYTKPCVSICFVELASRTFFKYLHFCPKMDSFRKKTIHTGVAWS
jgi:hypothetical protein